MGIRDSLRKLSESRAIRQHMEGLAGNRYLRWSAYAALGVVLVALLGGVPYVIFYGPPGLFQGKVGITFIHPDRMAEGSIEAFYVALMYGFGIAGLLLVQHATQRRTSQMIFLAVGLLLLLTSASMLLWIRSEKFV